MRRYFHLFGLVILALLPAAWYLLPRGTELGADLDQGGSMLVGRQAVVRPSPSQEGEHQASALEPGRQQLARAGAGAANLRAGETASMTVCVKGLIPKGQVLVAVFEKAAAFPNRDKAAHTRSAPVTSQQAEVRFENLPPGEYAVAVFQDLNGDSVLNKGAFGAPTEPYGFSNNARGSFGPPSFPAAAFQLAGGSNDVEVTVR